ncbi:hypothetical protein CYY_006849 [Polysphondylium violaceum]|uniref:Succinylglutamate desuccinylase n=1 Tax=Polysphondylium violaceum TaxID=133409 RepID=A0A8J4PPQ5_9MYCE|nr:hypothetical protein CYY_006849 [Polysphondylium violaceum]
MNQQIDIQDFLSLTLIGEQPSCRKGHTNYFNWQWLGVGILLLEPLHDRPLLSVVISAGIHGNETAPVEIVQQILNGLFSNTITLSCRLLLIFGNPQALRENKRYIHADMNRMFGGRWQKILHATDESRRVDLLEQTMIQFFDKQDGGKIHLDMHTAIRGSHHIRFGVLPVRPIPWEQDQKFLNWLGVAGLEALVFHQSPLGSFSHFSCDRFNALSCTMELGKALPFGQNNLTQFTSTQKAITQLISTGSLLQDDAIHSPPLQYKVVQQIIRSNHQSFQLLVSPDTFNFTPFPKGTRLSQHDDTFVQKETEYILFPNPNVAVGLRAALLLELHKN